MCYDTIIVGAGICGLTAAIELAAKGQHVLMLEAQDYIGGRMKSIPVGDGLYFNEGAHWFHGGDINPFYQWARARYDLGPIIEDKGAVSRRVSLEGRDVTREFLAVAKEFDDIAGKRMMESGDDFSMANIARDMHLQYADVFVKFRAQLWMAGDNPAEIAVRGIYEDPLGAGGWQLAKGMSHLIDQMTAEARGLGVVIRTEAEVVSALTSDGGAHVQTADGTLLEAKIALVTVPIGALKEKTIAFDRDMQNQLDEPLGGMEMGAFYKAALRVYDDYFTKAGIPVDSPVWSIDKNALKFVHAHTAGKPIITVFTGGMQARMMEGWDKERVRDFALEAITQTPFFPGIEGHIVGGPITTSWWSNRSTRGAYSLKKPDCKKSDPIRSGNIVVAGEAWLKSAKESPGQMAGAWKSAQKAVALILA